MKILKKITILSILIIIMLTYAQTLVFAAESELTLTPKPETNNIHLKWTGPLNSSYKVYQKKPGSNHFETIGLTDFSPEAIDEEVKVLNIYPTSDYNNAQLSSSYAMPNITVTYLDGQTEIIPKSAILKVWMEGGTVTEGSTVTNFRAYGKNPANGRQLIKVKHLSMKEFDLNPNVIWDYDVLMYGTWDANGWNTIRNESADVIGRYIDTGRGVFSGHDTIGSIFGKNFGISRLAEKFNIVRGKVGSDPELIGYDINFAWSYYSNKVRITKKGFLTQFPWNLGPVGTVLNIPTAHTLANGAKGNTWMEFENPEINVSQEGVAKTPNDLPQGINYNYYLTTWNNTAMIQTGHSNGNSTEDERKVLANTLFYLKQLTHKKEILDNSARDLENPNKPGNISTAVNEDNTTNIRFRRPEDNGSTYEYYVKGLDGAREFTSDTKSATITTGVKKYKYAVTEGDTDPEPDSWKEATTIGETESINIGEVNYTGTPKYIHIKSVDGAGNESEVYRQKLEKPNAQEIEITKEVVNGKKDYKVGEEITYSLKFKIKENETNKGKISNVSATDTYNSNYLELVDGSVVKDNTTTVNTAEKGTIRITTNELVYGKTEVLLETQHKEVLIRK